MFVSGRALEGVVAFHQSKRNSISRKCHPKPRKPGNCFHRRFGEVGNTGVSWARTARECYGLPELPLSLQDRCIRGGGFFPGTRSE